MTYVLTDGAATIVAYPYSINNLKNDNPNTSFPPATTNAQLASRNMFPVEQVEAPAFDELSQDRNEGTPLFDAERGWVQTWVVTNVSAEEEAARRAAAYENAEAAAIQEAKRLIAESDKAIIEAFESFRSLHPAFVAYRAALRNPSSLAGYPYVSEWPVEPESALGTELNIIGKFDQMVLATQGNSGV